MGIDEFPILPPDELEPEELSLVQNQEKNKESLESGELFRLEHLAESLRRIAGALAEREQEDLNPLINEQAISAIRSISTTLYNFSTNGTDIKEIEEQLSRLASVFDSFGDVPQQRIVRENTENLKRLAFQMRELGDVCLDLKSYLGSKEKRENEQTIADLNRIMGRSEKVWIWLRKKADLLDRR